MTANMVLLTKSARRTSVNVVPVVISHRQAGRPQRLSMRTSRDTLVQVEALRLWRVMELYGTPLLHLDDQFPIICR